MQWSLGLGEFVSIDGSMAVWAFSMIVKVQSYQRFVFSSICYPSVPADPQMWMKLSGNYKLSQLTTLKSTDKLIYSDVRYTIL